MISFIVCDDNDEVRKIYINIIKKTVMAYDFDYKIYSFSKYNNELKKVIEEELEQKIYLLDLEMPGKNGIEITKEIRKNDWDSQIIILTAHEELELRILKQKLLVLDFISKFDNYEEKLTDTLKLIIEKRQVTKSIRIKSEKNLYNIMLKDILYIYKNNINLKTMISTKIKDYVVNESLIDIEKKLDNRFCKTHRACIVNKDKIKKIDFKQNIIYFEGNKKIDYLSRNYKKNLKVEKC